MTERVLQFHLIVFFLLHELTLRLIISYVYNTTGPECSGSRPTVKLSTRYHSGSGGGRPMNLPASYSIWSLAWVYNGMLLAV